MTALALSRRKKLAFAAAAIGLALLVTLLGLLGADVYLHRRFQQSGGVNIWGYRGPIVGHKKPGEIRLVFLGGSTAFGYGVTWEQAIPAQLQQKLNARRPADVSTFTVVNLAYNNEGAYSFKYTLDDYKYLDYDIVCLYEGYNDMMGDPKRPNTSVFRHDSYVFRATGYLPILQIALREKASALRYGGDLAGYYRQMRGETTRTVFQPSLANRTAAGALDATAAIGESLERQVARVLNEPRHTVVGGDTTGCKYPWGDYCISMLTAIDRALGMGKRVIVITQPYLAGPVLRARHMDQQSTLVDALERKYHGDPRVRYVNLGNAVNIADPGVGYDHMHLTVPANAVVAAGLVEPVLEMTAQRADDHR